MWRPELHVRGVFKSKVNCFMFAQQRQDQFSLSAISLCCQAYFKSYFQIKVLRVSIYQTAKKGSPKFRNSEWEWGQGVIENAGMMGRGMSKSRKNLQASAKGQLKSGRIYEVIDFPKQELIYCKDFCPEIPNSIFYVSDSSLGHHLVFTAAGA